MEITIRYKKADIHKIYQDLVNNGELKVDEKLAIMKEEEIPFLLIHPSRKVINIFEFSNIFHRNPEFKKKQQRKKRRIIK